MESGTYVGKSKLEWTSRQQPPEEAVKLAAEAYVEWSVRTPSLSNVDRNDVNVRSGIRATPGTRHD